MRGSRVPCIKRDAGSRVVFALNVMHYYIYSYIIYVWNIYIYIYVCIKLCIYIYATSSYSLDSLASHIANLSLRSLHTLPERQEIYTQSLESDWNIRNEGFFFPSSLFPLVIWKDPTPAGEDGAAADAGEEWCSDAVMHKVGTRRGRK